MRTYSFDPDWVIPPGEHLADHLDEIGSPVAVLVTATGLPQAVIDGVIAGTEPITAEVAVSLAVGTGISAQMWLNLEKTYRDGLAAGKKVL